jgi:hypothetical protein
LIGKRKRRAYVVTQDSSPFNHIHGSTRGILKWCSCPNNSWWAVGGAVWYNCEWSKYASSSCWWDCQLNSITSRVPPSLWMSEIYRAKWTATKRRRSRDFWRPFELKKRASCCMTYFRLWERGRERNFERQYSCGALKGRRDESRVSKFASPMNRDFWISVLASYQWDLRNDRTPPKQKPPTSTENPCCVISYQNFKTIRVWVWLVELGKIVHERRRRNRTRLGRECVRWSNDIFNKLSYIE